MRTAIICIGITGMILWSYACSRHANLGFGLDVMKTGADSTRLPSVSIEKSHLKTTRLLYYQFQAADEDEIAGLLKRGLEQIDSYCRQHRLTTGKAVVFYYSRKPPFMFDVAREIDTLLDVQGEDGLKVRQLDASEAVIAHYKGPQGKSQLAYDAVSNWLVNQRREAKGIPFEIYQMDPAVNEDKRQWVDLYQLLH